MKDDFCIRLRRLLSLDRLGSSKAAEVLLRRLDKLLVAEITRCREQ